MFGRFTDLPNISYFHTAQRHYNSIKPIRGSDNLRPLCDTTNGRRKKHLQIIEREKDKAYALRVYDTDVITYLADGRILINNGRWATSTTHKFISEVLRWRGVGARTLGGETWLSLKDRGEFRIANGVDAVLQPDEDDVLTLLDPEPTIIHKLDRKAWNQVRKHHSAFTSYIGSMSKLIEPPENMHNYWSERHKTHQVLQGLLRNKYATRAAVMASEPNETWATALEIFTVGATKSELQRDFNAQTYNWVVTLVRSKFRKQAYDMLKCLYASSLFVEEEAPLGKYVKDSNARYMQ